MARYKSPKCMYDGRDCHRRTGDAYKNSREATMAAWRQQPKAMMTGVRLMRQGLALGLADTSGQSVEVGLVSRSKPPVRLAMPCTSAARAWFAQLR